MVEFGITAMDGYQQLVEMSEFYSKDAGDMNAIMGRFQVRWRIAESHG